MTCGSCDTSLRADARSCPVCGSPVEAVAAATGGIRVPVWQLALAALALAAAAAFLLLDHHGARSHAQIVSRDVRADLHSAIPSLEAYSADHPAGYDGATTAI